MKGLSTKEALVKLKEDVIVLLEDLSKEHSYFRQLHSAFLTSIRKETLSLLSYLISIMYIIVLLVLFAFLPALQTDKTLLIEAFILIVVVMWNFYLSLHESDKKMTEVENRIRHLIEFLKYAYEDCSWTQENYPHLCAPISPCITLQWTYRDDVLVNLPWALLVKNDVIVVKPGQEVPGYCQCVDDENLYMTPGQIYQPATLEKENFFTPRTRVPLNNKEFTMLETPILSNLRINFEKSNKKPVSVHSKLRYLLVEKFIEGILLPVMIITILISTIVWYCMGTTVGHWAEMCILQTISATLPLIQLIFPTFWIVLNCYGLARFKKLSETRQKLIRPKSHSISEEVNDPLIEALSETNLRADHIKSCWRNMYSIFSGKENMITRTTNIVHVLGTLSALCCVDKKGILSWPNPTAEKVFLFRNFETISSSKTSLAESESQSVENISNGKPQPLTGTVSEVLDLTHDQNAAFCVQFDDATWHCRLPRLKPLGLAALLNTCKHETAEHYAQLCAHLTCEALLTEDLVPVTNRRCLCELAKQIGFKDEAADPYCQVENIAVFRHLQEERIRRETRFVRSLQLNSAVKVPLPHMLSVVVRDPTKQLQLLTQGTADIVLDSCLDYWDGDDLTTLTPADRKKALDFYQRNSLTAYCTAFSYKPLCRGVSKKLAAQYLELPPDSNYMQSAYSSVWNDQGDVHFHSTDSLLFSDPPEVLVDDANGFYDLQNEQVFLGMVTMQYQAQSDMVELIERLERSCIRFVHFSKENELRSRVFSEKMGLESGWNCHISLMSEQNDSSNQNELQAADCAFNDEMENRQHDSWHDSTKIFEKERAETPRQLYYCSSSDLSRYKSLSSSAPGAIHLDHNTVKFYNERPRHSITAQNLSTADDNLSGSMQSELELSGLENCRSISCLTDSTDRSAPVNFDMSNRAKLPRGIENIRPHLEKVDNVPLLVSLFTDCTSSSTQEMMNVMQEYGEVVCLLGSSANKDNCKIFLQADASIAIEPLYPVLCQKLPPYKVPSNGVGPVDVARALTSVPCSLSMTRDTDVSLYSLIAMSRHFMASVWNGTELWMSSLCAISCLQFMCIVCGLPNCLSLGGSLLIAWLWCGISASLALASPDATLMQRVTTKYRTFLNWQTFAYVYWCYGLKFFPAVVLLMVQYSFTLHTFCLQIADSAPNITCFLIYPRSVSSQVTYYDAWTTKYYDGYYLTQCIILTLLTVHLVVISMSFVHREYLCWQKGFWTNKFWLVAVLCTLLVEGTFVSAMLTISWAPLSSPIKYSINWQLYIIYLMSPCIVFAFNELIKWQEIRSNERYQKRTRLDFGTKLGMNSPFC